MSRSSVILRPRARTVVALLGLLLATAIAWAAAPTATANGGTCTRYWTGSVSSAWETSANWSQSNGGSAASVPTATDVACMSTAPARTTVVVSDSRQVAGVTFPANGAVQPVLRILGSATLQVGSASGAFDSTVNTFDLQSGSTLSGSAVTTAGTVGSLSGVNLGQDGAGTGSLVISTGGTAALASGQRVLIDGGYSLVNNGTVTLSNGYVQFGYYYGSGSAPNKVLNQGTWTITNTTNEPFYDTYGGGRASLVNATGGTIAFTAPTAAGTIPRSSTALTNNGTVNVTRGHLANSVDASGTGTYNLATGTSYDHTGGTLNLTGTTWTGPGTFNLSGGTLTTATTATLPATTKLHSGSLSGGGTYTIPTGGTATLAAGESPVVDEGSTLINNGAVTANDGYIQFGYNTGAGGALNKVTNNGTWTVTNTTNDPFYDPYSKGSLTNATGGTLTFTAPTAAGTIPRSSTALTNNGTVNVTRGHLANSVDASGTGTYNLATGTSYDHTGGTLNLTGTTWTGPGTFNLSGGTLTTATTATLPATTKLHSGSLSGGGTYTIPTGGTATLAAGESPVVDEGSTLINNGAVTANDGYIQFGYNTGAGGALNKVTNNGTWTVTNTTNDPFYDPYSKGSLTNATGGTLTFTAPTAAGTIPRSSTALTNNGTVNVTLGHLANSVDGSGTGTYNLATGTSYDHTGGTLNLTGTTWTGPGTFNLSGGTLTGSGPLAPVTALHSGTLDGGGTLTVPTGGAATVGSGDSPLLDNGTTLANNGSVSISGNGYLLFGYHTGAGGQRNAAVNNGTWSFTNPSQAPLYNPYGDRGTFRNSSAGVVTASPGAGNTLDLTTLPFTNDGELRASSGTTTVSPTNLSAAGVLENGALTTQGGVVSLPNAIVTNKGAITVNSGGIQTGGANALPALRTNTATGSLTLVPTLTLTGPLTNAGAVRVRGGTLRASSYTQTAGSTRIDPTATLKSGTTGTGAVAINAGSLLGGGTVQGVVSNAGVLQPGDAGSPLSITGSYTQATGGGFGVTVNGATTAGTDFSKLTDSGAATLNGRLSIGTAPSYNPPVGTSVRILDAGSRTGTFSTVEGADTLPAGKYWRVQYDATGVSLLVVADPAASVGSVAPVEGDAGTTTLTFPVTLDQASDRSVTLDYTTVDLTATAPGDYVSSSAP